LINQSPRRSTDVDYSWEGDLEEKRNELGRLFERRLLPEVKRKYGYDGSVMNADGPQDVSAAVKSVILAFYNTALPHSRIELPVEITRMALCDPPVAVAVDGAILLTATDQDMVESKVVALLNRTFVKARDFVDLFLFRNHLAADSRARLLEKFDRLDLSGAARSSRMALLRDSRTVYISSIREIIAGQMDPASRETLEAGGGAETVYDSAIRILDDTITPPGGPVT